MAELQALGTALVALPTAQLAAMRLPRVLAEAAREAQHMAGREAKRRQLQLIGRLMRELDPEPIRAQLADVRGVSSAMRARHLRLEQWRARLLADDAALTDFAREYPTGNLQAIRNTVRNARREKASRRPPRAFRDLYRLLRDAAGNSLAAGTTSEDAD